MRMITVLVQKVPSQFDIKVHISMILIVGDGVAAHDRRCRRITVVAIVSFLRNVAAQDAVLMLFRLPFHLSFKSPCHCRGLFSTGEHDDYTIPYSLLPKGKQKERIILGSQAEHAHAASQFTSDDTTNACNQ